jgi:two-component system, OmpR family, sensor histidine kinase KdpD
MKNGIMGASRVAREAWPGMLAAGLLTWAAYQLHIPYAPAGFVYLLVVVLQSLRASFLASAVVSIFAVGCLDYFLVPPVLTWRIADPGDALAIAVFLLTALIITHLAARAQAHTLAARRHRKELELLFRATWEVLALEPEAAGAKCVQLFRDLFDFQAVCMFDGVTAEVRIAGIPSAALAERTRDACLQDRDSDADGSRLRSLRVAGRTIGAIGFEGGAGSAAVVGALSVLGASTLERARASEASIKIAADERSEALRSAVLDAFAHEFKTPLTAILAAAGALDDADALNSRQLAWVQRVESEASRLGQMTTRLLRVARLDREEVQPRLQVTDLGALVTEIVHRSTASSGHGALPLKLAGQSVPVMADPELLTLALLPLLESALQVEVSRDRGFGIVQVRTEGGSLAPGDEHGIPEADDGGRPPRSAAPGVGTGLYLARKIAIAHQGTLEMTIEPAGTRTTENQTVTFRMRLPSPGKGADHVLRAS